MHVNVRNLAKSWELTKIGKLAYGAVLTVVSYYDVVINWLKVFLVVSCLELGSFFQTSTLSQRGPTANPCPFSHFQSIDHNVMTRR